MASLPFWGSRLDQNCLLKFPKEQQDDDLVYLLVTSLDVGRKQVESVDQKLTQKVSPRTSNLVAFPFDLEASWSLSVSRASEVAPPFRGVRCASLGRPNGLVSSALEQMYGVHERRQRSGGKKI